MLLRIGVFALLLWGAGTPLATAANGSGTLELTPAAGRLGEAPLFAARAAYRLSPRLALEAELDHVLGQQVSALQHAAGLRWRAVELGRAEGFLGAGFGTFTAQAGGAVGAKSVTRSALRLGGGVLWWLRDDIGFRLDGRHHRIFLHQPTTTGTYSLTANELSVGLVFARQLAPGGNGF